MTDFASSVTAAKPSWTWWMTTAAAAAMRMRNLREHHGGDGQLHGSCYGDADEDELVAGIDGKRKRAGYAEEEYWTAADDRFDGGSPQLPAEHDSTTVGPLDLSVKATVTAAAAHAIDRHAAARTRVKRSTAAVTNGRLSKKSSAGKATAGGGGGGGRTAAAVKAAARKLLPQLLQDSRVDRSSPVSGTIIVPATPDQSQRTSPPSPYAVAAADCADGADRQDDEYDGGDIDPEFNVVVATEEARRRLESIPNALGPYRCRLCGVQYADAFALARHRCRCIVHVRYRCPECDKVFQCPANLASHRRWHGAGAKSTAGGTNNNNNGDGRVKRATENDDGNGPERKTTVRDVGGGDGEAADNGETTVTAQVTSTAAVTMSVAGFKKNILQRAVQAAAAAANGSNESPKSFLH